MVRRRTTIRSMLLGGAASALVCLLAGMGLAAQSSAPAKAAAGAKSASKQAASRPKPKAAPKAADLPGAPPKGAVEVEPGTFRWVDPKGQAWIYSKSPFGWMKGPEQPGFQTPDPVPTDWTVVEEGDSLTFERPYAFGGTKRWTVKKSELSETEAAVWKRSQMGSAGK